MELLKVDTLEKAQKKIAAAAQDIKLKTVKKNSLEALGYVLSADIIALEDVPLYRRSSVDGYAIKAKDSYGAKDGEMFLDVVDSIGIDEISDKELSDNEAIRVQTGSFLPKGADSVMMLEYTRAFLDDKIVIYKPIAPLENIIEKGEDIKKGEVVLKKGTLLKEENIGILISLGIKEVEVYERLKAAIISSGDELCDPFENIPHGKIRDINSYTLSMFAKKSGFTVEDVLCIKDQKEELLKAVKTLKEQVDIIILSGGSSKGDKDYSEEVFKECGEVLIHGIAIKPGKPTIVAFDPLKEVLMFGLPGNPLAAIIMYKLLIEDYLFKKEGLPKPFSLYAKIKENVASNSGRATCLLVNLEYEDGELIATPLYSKSANISILNKVKGYTLIKESKEGLKVKEMIEVVLL